MPDLKIESKIMDKFGTRYILYFLADLDFTWDGFNIGRKKSKALCWLGKIEDIQKKIHDSKNIEEVVREEIATFRLEFNHVIQELYTLGTEDQVLLMVKGIEDFITETVNMSYD